MLRNHKGVTRFAAVSAAATVVMGGIVTVAASPAFAAAATYAASPNSGGGKLSAGPSGVTTVVSITGRDFQTAAGSSKIAPNGVKLAATCGAYTNAVDTAVA